jgi:hypothetical protein
MEPGDIHIYEVDMPENLRCEIERLLAEWGYLVARKERELYINLHWFTKGHC